MPSPTSSEKRRRRSRRELSHSTVDTNILLSTTEMEQEVSEVKDSLDSSSSIENKTQMMSLNKL